MSTTNFVINKRKSSKKNETTQKSNNVISFSTSNKQTSYLTYIVNGVEEVWKGKYSRLRNGSYIYEHTGITKLPLEKHYSYTYKTIDSHFSYFDNEGHERTCNILDSIEYDPESNTYTGEVGLINYEDEEVEIYASNNDD